MKDSQDRCGIHTVSPAGYVSQDHVTNAIFEGNHVTHFTFSQKWDVKFGGQILSMGVVR